MRSLGLHFCGFAACQPGWSIQWTRSNQVGPTSSLSPDDHLPKPGPGTQTTSPPITTIVFVFVFFVFVFVGAHWRCPHPTAPHHREPKGTIFPQKAVAPPPGCQRHGKWVSPVNNLVRGWNLGMRSVLNRYVASFFFKETCSKWSKENWRGRDTSLVSFWHKQSKSEIFVCIQAPWPKAGIYRRWTKTRQTEKRQQAMFSTDVWSGGDQGSVLHSVLLWLDVCLVQCFLLNNNRPLQSIHWCSQQ